MGHEVSVQMMTFGLEGAMKVTTGKMLKEVCCIHSYLAPEILEGLGYHRLPTNT